MNFEEFWQRLQEGGETPKRDRYSVNQDGQLHIESPGNQNKEYHFTQETVRRYFEEDIPRMTAAEFRYGRSSYFYNVYLHISGGA